MYRNAMRVVAFERSEEVKIWTLTKLLVDLLRRESFVGKDDPLADVVVNDKGAVGRRVDGVAWEDFSAKWFHAFEIVGVDHGDVTAAFDAGLAGEGRQVVDGTGVLLKRAIDCYMVRLLDEADPLLVEDLPFSAVFPELLQERRDLA